MRPSTRLLLVCSLTVLMLALGLCAVLASESEGGAAALTARASEALMRLRESESMHGRADRSELKPGKAPEPLPTPDWTVVLEDEPLGPIRARLARTPKGEKVAALNRQSAVIAGRRSRVKRLVEQLEPRKTRRYDDLEWALAGFVTQMDTRTAEALQRDPAVKSVSRNMAYPAEINDTTPYIGSEELQKFYGGDGRGTRIAIIDSGVDYTHPDLGGGFGPGHRVVGGWDFVDGDGDPMDVYGHGTIVAGVAGADGNIDGMAPKAEILAYRAGDAYMFAGVQSIDHALDPDGDPATDDGADVINISYGQGYGTALAIDNAFRAGVVTAISLGNDRSYWTSNRAADSEAIGVSANTDPGAWGYGIFDFSSRGPVDSYRVKPDVSAPGLVMKTTRAGGGYETAFGTSLAAPHVAGLIAQLKSVHPEWDAATLRSAAIQGAEPFDSEVHVAEQGSGALRAMGSFELPGVMIPPTISFGFADPTPAVWQDSRSVTLRNISGVAKSFSLGVDAQQPAGIVYAVTPAEVMLGAGEECTVTLTARIDTAVAPDCPHPTGFYDGRVTAEADGKKALVPFLLGFNAKAPLRATVFGPTIVNPGQAYTFALAVNGGAGQRYTLNIDDGEKQSSISPRYAGADLLFDDFWAASGEHALRVKVDDAFGRTSGWSEPLTVSVGWDQPNGAPRVPVLVAPADGVVAAGSAVAFTGWDAEGAASSVEVDWGDGVTSTLTPAAGGRASGAHGWSAYGEYAVKARAIDVQGLTSGWSEPVTLRYHAAPGTPSAPVGPPVASAGIAAVYMSAAAHPDGGGLSYEFEFGDGGTGVTSYDVTAGVSMEHTWTRPGVYHVRARARDEFGATSAWSPKTVVIVHGDGTPPAPSLTVQAGTQPTWSEIGATVQGADPAGRAIRYEVEWGGTLSRSPLVAPGTPVVLTHTYAPSNSHVRTLKARSIDADGDVSDWSATTTISVNTSPTLSLSDGTGTPNVAVYLTVTTSDADQDAVTKRVDWGDGTTQTFVAGQAPTHVYAAVGTYAVSVRAEDSFGAWTAATATMRISVPATFTAVPGEAYVGCGSTYAPHVVAVDPEGAALTYTVDWGDGTSSVVTAPSGEPAPLTHVYTLGYRTTKYLRARVTNSRGLTTSSPNWLLRIGPPPTVAGLPSGRVLGAVGAEYEYRTSAMDPAGDYALTCFFDWGDGTGETPASAMSGAQAVATHAWGSPGEYSVRVRAQNEYGAAQWSEALTVTIENVPPVKLPVPAKPRGPALLLPGTEATYVVDVGGSPEFVTDVTISWGDGSRSFIEGVPGGSTLEAAHTWANPGGYPISAFCSDAYGRPGSPSEALDVVVDTAPLAPVWYHTPSYAVTSSPVSFCADVLDPDGGPLFLTFDWGDGTFSSEYSGWSGESVWITHRFETLGEHQVRVMVTDEFGQTSPWSPAVTVSVAPAYAAPVVRGTFTQDLAGNRIGLDWNASAEARFDHYVIHRGTGPGQYDQVFTTTAPSLEDRGIMWGLPYYYAVAVVDAQGNEGRLSDEICVVAADLTPPAPPVGLRIGPDSLTGVLLSWDPNSEADLSYYAIYRAEAPGGPYQQVAWVYAPTTSVTDMPPRTDTPYYYYVVAADGGGNQSEPSSELVGGVDTMAPGRPTGLVASGSGPSTIDLRWTPATDRVAVVGYRIERAASSKGPWSFVGTSDTTAYTVAGLAANTAYYFRVQAVDFGGNLGPYSAAVTGRTLAAPPDTTRPTAPANLAATALSSSQISLSWSASTDNVGVTTYRIERSADGVSFAEVGTSSSPSYTASGLSANTRYWFRARAQDAAGNLSVYSTTADATTLQGPAQPVRYEDSAGSLSLVGTWLTASNPSHSNGAIVISGITGNTATFPFTGTKVSWVGAKAADYGQAKVYIDGVFMATVDCYAKNPAYQSALYTSTVLAPGAHTIRIEVAGTKHRSSRGYLVPVDAFDVTP